MTASERTRTLAEVVMLTKARLKGQFNEQIDLYRKGVQLAVVTHFAEDPQERYGQLAASCAFFGADEVVHAAEAWIVDVDPAEIDDFIENYHHGDNATDARRKEVLVVMRLTKTATEMLMTPFTEADGELVYGETEDIDEPGVGMVPDALRTGMREAWQYRQPVRQAAAALQSIGLLVLAMEAK